MERSILLGVLVIAVVANTAIVVVALVALRSRRGDDAAASAASRAASTASRAAAGALPEPMRSRFSPLPAASAVPATMEPGLPDSWRDRTPPPAPPAALLDAQAPPVPAPLDPSSTSLPTSGGRWVLPPHDDPRAERTIHALVHGGRRHREPTPSSGLQDEPATNAGALGSESPSPADLRSFPGPAPTLEDAAGWAETLRREDDRRGRYPRPVTVVVAELDGLDALADRLGRAAAERLVPSIADELRRNARAADVVARTGDARFHALLPETDEGRARFYVERVRTAVEKRLGPGATVRLVMGLASPSAEATLTGALRTAEERLARDRTARAGASRHPEEASTPGTPRAGSAPDPHSAPAIPPQGPSSTRHRAPPVPPPDSERRLS